ncbi:MAG: fatty acid desaturase [Chromatiales bacterium]|nr:fatty acid desaturase [Chromatiales bacterium]
MSTHPELSEVSNTLQIDWYRCDIARDKLIALLERSDAQGWWLVLGHLALFSCTALAVVYSFQQAMWVTLACALFAHGTVTSFFPVSPVHELGHGTVFKTPVLNRVFLRVFSLIGWWNHYEYAMSHTYHHRYTLHPIGDREVVLPRYPSLELSYLVQLFTFNVFGGTESTGFFPKVVNTVRTALGGYRKDKGDWFKALYDGYPQERRRAVLWARYILAFHSSVLLASYLLELWMLPVVLTLPVFTANALRYFVGMPMHCGLRSNVPDFRQCVRSIELDPISEFLYWHMNWHTEHHMFAAVPCYQLAKLHRTVQAQMPAPRTLIGAWREMRESWRRQQIEPSYEFDTPIPVSADTSAREHDVLAASIGNLAPSTLRE